MLSQSRSSCDLMTLQELLRRVSELFEAGQIDAAAFSKVLSRFSESCDQVETTLVRYGYSKITLWENGVLAVCCVLEWDPSQIISPGHFDI